MGSGTKHTTIFCRRLTAAAWLASAGGKADGLSPDLAGYAASMDPGRPLELSLFLYGLLLLTFGCFVGLFVMMLRSQAEERAQARREREQAGDRQGKVNAFRLRPGRPIEWPEAQVRAAKPRLRLIRVAALGRLRRRRRHAGAP
jgi:hypothetical protein